MPIAVELEFDQNTSSEIRSIWKDMSDYGVSQFLHHSPGVPHLSLAMYNGIEDMAAFIRQVNSFSYTISKPAINLNSIGLFNVERNIIYLAVTVTSDLIFMHKNFYNHMSEYSKGAWRFYMPGVWVPHVTVAINVEEDKLMRGVEIAAKRFKPMMATAEALHVIDVQEAKTIERIGIL